VDPFATLGLFGSYLVGVGLLLLVVNHVSPRRGLRGIALGVIALGLLCWLGYVLFFVWVVNQLGSTEA
jgi:hypothetical protein